MDNEVDSFVKHCRGCLLVSAPNPPEPMKRHELPNAPWEDLAIDFLGPLPEGQYLFVVVDYYSRYYEICEMVSITAEDTIRELIVIFSRFGIPLSLTADNAPQLSEECDAFANFCHTNGIKLINTIPYWPQMNGEVERQNRTILKRLQIAQELGHNWKDELQRFLLTYRASPHTTTGRSPAELLFGRKIRTKIPQLANARMVEDEAVRDRDHFQKAKGKEYSDEKRLARERPISEGDRVLSKRMRKDNKLSSEYTNEEFIIKRKFGSDVIVESVETGKQYRRNVAHLKKIPNDAGSIENVPDLQSTIDPDTADSEMAPENTNHQSEDGELAQPRKRHRQEPTWFQNYIPH
ncbi:uncharacterized protein K02A2.6-like [Uranotaenia lowii]|uniref:uncharacterized protein K02A2.6-like n=1 Tax=Uranotaenia lowii TaxID=190385 RepID=UPI00247A6234|nr:uncharacterized protein K02A2.6-like [Uranotaenia lowii]